MPWRTDLKHSIVDRDKAFVVVDVVGVDGGFVQRAIADTAGRDIIVVTDSDAVAAKGAISYH